MKYLLLSLMLSYLNFIPLNAEIYNGYIVTKDGVRLTGQVGNLNQSYRSITINFINDFGDSYYLAPELIKGFVLQQDSNLIAFESKFDVEEERWSFMQVLSKGNGLNLYGTVQARSVKKIIYEGEAEEYFKVDDYYLELKGKLPVKVQRFGFRKQMKTYLRRKAPKLAAKIGDKDYRYRDIINIIDEYNTIVKNRKKFL